ncbi:MurR/RpiR family transcriptional regulator [Promicromonospora thailandica]|uniref:Transcriptional regulator, RpiR family n=1 Tax=Promicromonospora thailandica TaxID=765201 RepID=A0A9X2G8Z5_9MICO|nr:MurR/RpiR family transcriptional regulator [Promicromonospora thailandica]MCP2264156.1 transcriptional regulator, RpiR family [Promicromonospora thailandica]
MTIPAAPPLEDRVASAYRGLSPQERRAADTLLDHLGELGTYRATELAALAGVSKATMSRLFRKLGYEDFEGLRAHLRARRGRGLPIAVGPPPGLRERLEQEVANLEKAYALLDDAVLDEIAAALATAGDVVVVGRRGSLGPATQLRRNLVQVRGRVHLAPAPGQSLADDLVGLGPRDVVVVVSVRRHAFRVAEMVESLLADGVRVLLLADSSLRHLAGSVTWWIECPISTRGAFDSMVAPVSLVAAISDRVHEVLDGAPARVDAIDDRYALLREIDER